MVAQFAHKAQFPLNTVGPKGQHAFCGVGKVFFTGTTGLVGTAYGIPGLTATRLSTGAYKVQFPASKSVDIIPGVQAPTGVHYDVQVGNVQPYSGTAELHISQRFNTINSQSTGTSQPTGLLRPQNPASGTCVNLLFFVAPITPY